jgi:hypothetical protein
MPESANIGRSNGRIANAQSSRGVQSKNNASEKAKLLSGLLTPSHAWVYKPRDLDSIIDLYKSIVDLPNPMSFNQNMDSLMSFATFMQLPSVRELVELMPKPDENVTLEKLKSLIWMYEISTTADKLEKVKKAMASYVDLMKFPNLAQVLKAIHELSIHNPSQLNAVKQLYIENVSKQTTINDLHPGIIDNIVSKFPSENAHMFSLTSKHFHTAVKNSVLNDPKKVLSIFANTLVKDSMKKNTCLDKFIANLPVSNGGVDVTRKKFMDAILRSKASVDFLIYRCFRKSAFGTMTQLLQELTSRSKPFPLEIFVLLIMMCDNEQVMRKIFLAISKKRNLYPGESFTLSQLLLHCERINEESMKDDDESIYVYYLEEAFRNEAYTGYDPNKIKYFKMTCFLPMSVLSTLLNKWKIPIGDKAVVDRWIDKAAWPLKRPVANALRRYMQLKQRNADDDEFVPPEEIEGDGNVFQIRNASIYDDGGYLVHHYVSKFVKENLTQENAMTGGRRRSIKLSIKSKSKSAPRGRRAPTIRKPVKAGASS